MGIMMLGLAVIGLAAPLHAEDVPSTSSRATHSATGRSSGGTISLQALEAKLNEILDKQQQILTRLDEVMAELQVVKVRATIR